MLMPSDIKIEAKMAGKSPLTLVAFSACCARRLSNTLLSRKTNNEVKSLVDRAFIAIFEYLHGSSLQIDKNLIDEVYKTIPDEDSDSEISPSELGMIDDTLSSIYYAMKSVDGSPESTKCAALRATDCVFREASSYLEPGILTKELEARLWQSVIVQRELTRQKRDLDDLVSMPDASQPINALLERANHESAI